MKMSLHSINRNLLFALLIIYFAQGTFYDVGSAIAKICLVIIFLISGFYYFLTLFIQKKNGLFYTSWSILLIINILGFILTGDMNNNKEMGMFKNILGCLLPFYPFYYFAIKEELKSKHLIIFFILLLPLTVSQFYVNQNISLSENTDTENVVNNVAYSFVMLIPYVFLLKDRKVMGSIIMILLMFFIIQSAKRGAIISGVSGILIYFYFQFQTINQRRRISGLLLGLILITSMSVLIYHFFQDNEFLRHRLSALFIEGSTSGRNEIYYSLFNSWYNSDSVFKQFFGYGFASSVVIAGDYAHNDWLELLSNFGLIGLFIYIFLFFSVIRLLRQNNWNTDKRTLFLTIIVMWSIISLISMWYTSIGMYTQSILLAYLIGSNKKSIA